MLNIKPADTDPDMAVIFSALGDRTRLEIITRLRKGTDQSVSSLTEGLPLTRQGVSRHLRVLEQAGLIGHRRVGRETRYTLEAETLNYAKDYLARASAQWDEAMARLATHLEEDPVN